ncbi:MULTISPECIES: DUF802 domain-containing protein [unclassified Oleiphilus]|uniref:DUF802 domain-containing protein n=1 Tax=unclassified Oleiphilus TaxID=2631174 RepID=UPI0007C2782B|nr:MULTISPECIES: DUF802 domain-containing protein [unclassified Oleiphilus]KZY46379.1 hypothetical protein A3732_07630 [Oleiphilus sp. HI0050]KZZ38069.1 hypothetical protein A3757_08920 [Oleiphilus sp. HI0117]KZZ38251.1 hypothetical protein A3756_10530 [Oleiphilus sp. HI0086]
MNKLLFGLAFLLGALAIIGMSWVFLGSDTLALLITVVIGVVFSIGTLELLRFQKATQTLSVALKDIPKFAVQAESDNENQFDKWLLSLHASLRNAVQLRIEGERIGLPAPVVTPYLVGLLVMLGLLGTFVGMVDTLQGAVTALQGTTELEAIRTGLAAPINGLGLAFGTSVAGVAASAMLGLMSTLSRRERVIATRELDACIAHEFKGFSLVHNRQETYKALQAQALALPQVADQLQTMALNLEKMGSNLGEQLNQKQDSFHTEVKQSYQHLAETVSEAISSSVSTVQAGLADSGRLAGESMRPVFEESMSRLVEKVSDQTSKSHQQFSTKATEHLDFLNGRFSKTADEVGSVWRKALEEQALRNQQSAEQIKQTLSEYSELFDAKTQTMLESLNQNLAQRDSQNLESEKARQTVWQQAMIDTQTQSSASLHSASQDVADKLNQLTQAQLETSCQVADKFTEMTDRLGAMSEGISLDWQNRADKMLAQQAELVEKLSDSQQLMDEQTKQKSEKLLAELAGLFAESNNLLIARREDESRWLHELDSRMNGLAASVREELSSLRDEEAGRANAAAETMNKLQQSLSQQVAQLSETIEKPMTELIETASETPKVAAEVISKLREEISNNMERDNHLLEERQRIMAELDGLSGSLSESSSQQREAIASLVETSSSMLDNISSRFDQHIDAEVNKLSDIVVEAAASTTDIASLGDAFGKACQQFSESNELLGESLQRIESALEQSSERSNEQLGYYVSQAREVIDHSVLSQKALFEELRELSMKQAYEQSSTESA